MFLLDQQELIANIQLYTQLLVYAVLPILLIFLITLSATKNNSNYCYKAFVMLVLGSVLSLLFIIATILDYSLHTVHRLGLFTYLAFIITSLLLTFAFSFVLYLRGKRRFQRLSFKKTAPSIDRNVIRYSYIVFHCDNKVLLQKNKDLYKAIEFKHDKKHIFEDETLVEIAKSFNLNTKYSDFKLVGKYTVKAKKTSIYSCYFIDCNINEDILSDKYELVDQLDLMKYAMDDRDRKIILRTLIRQQFDIKE